MAGAHKKLASLFASAAILTALPACDNAPKDAPQDGDVRAMTEGEKKLAKSLFSDGVDTSCARFHFHAAARNDGIISEPGNDNKCDLEVYGRKFGAKDYAAGNAFGFGGLAYDLTTLWQNRQGKNWKHSKDQGVFYALNPHLGFDEYGPSQQAAIIEDYARRFLHPLRASRWIPAVYGGDRMDTDLYLQKVVEDKFPQAKDARIAFSDIKTRNMTSGEAALALRLFGDELNVSDIRMRTHPEKVASEKGEGSSVMASVNSTKAMDFWSNRWASNDYSKDKSADNFAVFLHEMTHIWQKQTGMKYTQSEGRDYLYPLDSKFKFTDYGVEQQGAMVEDYARRFLHPEQDFKWVNQVYGWSGACEREDLLKKTIEDQFPGAKQARLAFEAEHEPASKKPVREMMRSLLFK